MLIQYQFLLLHNLVWQVDVREGIGVAIIALISLLLFLNLTVVIVASLQPLCRKLYLQGLRRKARA